MEETKTSAPKKKKTWRKVFAALCFLALMEVACGMRATHFVHYSIQALSATSTHEANYYHCLARNPSSLSCLFPDNLYPNNASVENVAAESIE